MTTLRLTRLGEFVARYTCFGTPPSFWTKLWTEVNRTAEQDGEWEGRLKEIEQGAREMRERYYQLNNPTMPEAQNAQNSQARGTE